MSKTKNYILYFILFLVILKHIPNSVEIYLINFLRNFKFFFINNDFLINFFGILLGSFFAWIIAIWQFNKQKKHEKEKELQYLELTISRMITELNDNKYFIEKILNIIDQTSPSDSTVIEWSKSLLPYIKETTYLDLVKSGINEELPDYMQENIFNSYRQIRNSKSLIHQLEYSIEIINKHDDSEEQHIEKLISKNQEELEKANNLIEKTINNLRSYNKKTFK